MRKLLGFAVFACLLSAAAHADTYTYKYVGPTFRGGTDHVEVAFTTSTPLAPSKSFIDQVSANVITGGLSVVGPNGVVAGMQLPLSTFQIHTNSTASATVPGIDSWDLLGDISNLSGLAPTMTGVHYQAYTMNTLAFIPGSDIPGAVGLVTGPYDYDQGTITTFYASCAGVAGCALAGNGQPYAGNYSGIINPSLTTMGNWTLTVNVTQPTPSPVALTGTLPDGVVNVSYGASLTATGGTPPYRWTASGLPAGLSIDAVTGVVSGAPTAAGGYSPTVVVTDARGQSASVTSSVVISAPVSCVAPAGAKSFENKGRIANVGAGYIVVGTTVIQTSACTKVEWNGAKGFAIGQRAESKGFVSGGAYYATKITIN
jgi:hypothetical protein